MLGLVKQTWLVKLHENLFYFNTLKRYTNGIQTSAKANGHWFRKTLLKEAFMSHKHLSLQYTTSNMQEDNVFEVCLKRSILTTIIDADTYMLSSAWVNEWSFQQVHTVMSKRVSWLVLVVCTAIFTLRPQALRLCLILLLFVRIMSAWY